jgi:hypothetical protein
MPLAVADGHEVATQFEMGTPMPEDCMGGDGRRRQL